MRVREGKLREMLWYYRQNNHEMDKILTMVLTKVMIL